MIVDWLTKLLPGLLMIVLLSYYALFYSFNCYIHELFWLIIGFFVAFYKITNPAFCKTNSSGKTLDTRKKYFADRYLLPDTSHLLFSAYHMLHDSSSLINAI